jgi:hypothetical protein
MLKNLVRLPYRLLVSFWSVSEEGGENEDEERNY